MPRTIKSAVPRVPAGFPTLLTEIKDRIRQAQSRAMSAANAELVRLYWDIGRLIFERQGREGWGASVIPRLARALKGELAEVKGFSERNIGRMIAFYRAYAGTTPILPPVVARMAPASDLPPPVAKLPHQSKLPQVAARWSAPAGPPRNRATESPLWTVPWAHHVILLEKVKDLPTRLWYMQQTIANGWSRSVLLAMIQSQAHRRQGKAITNFDRLLPPSQSDLARQTLKDPYIFDFLTLEEPFHERELETNLLRQLERFLLELGQGFAFVGRQLHVDVGESDFYIDLLFYHLRLRCFVVIELKKGEFKPEYAVKMNFYLNVVDDKLRHDADEPSIGLILCQNRNHIVAEYALRGMNKPISVSEYELTRALPPSLRSVLPTVEAIEAELSESAGRTTTESQARTSRTRARATARTRKHNTKLARAARPVRPRRVARSGS